jgi:hypothetical protein
MALAALTTQAASTSQLQMPPSFSLSQSIELLSANNGRIYALLGRVTDAPDFSLILRCHHAPVGAELPPRGKRTGSFRREIRADPQLIRVSDCNDNPPPISRYRRLGLHLGDAAACPGRAGVKQPHHFSAAAPRQLGNGKSPRRANLLRKKA